MGKYQQSPCNSIRNLNAVTGTKLARKSIKTANNGATGVGMPFLAYFTAVRVSYPYTTCGESTATSNSSPYYYFRFMSTSEVVFIGSTIADRPSFGIGVDYEVVEVDSKCPLTAIFPLPVHRITGNSIEMTPDREA